MHVFERVVLPRVSDVASCLGELLKHAGADDADEFYIIDFSDAFYTLKLHPSEQSHTVVKGNDGRYYILLSVCFGLCCGPLVWGRLAAAFLRLGQSTMVSREEDPSVTLTIPSLWLLGHLFDPAPLCLRFCGFFWGPLLLGERPSQLGTQVEWIGVALQLEGGLLNALKALKVTLTPDKTEKLFELFAEVLHAGRQTNP